MIGKILKAGQHVQIVRGTKSGRALFGSFLNKVPPLACRLKLATEFGQKN